jgi:hypothetical protein
MFLTSLLVVLHHLRCNRCNVSSEQNTLAVADWSHPSRKPEGPARRILCLGRFRRIMAASLSHR